VPVVISKISWKPVDDISLEVPATLLCFIPASTTTCVRRITFSLLRRSTDADSNSGGSSSGADTYRQRANLSLSSAGGVRERLRCALSQNMRPPRAALWENIVLLECDVFGIGIGVRKRNETVSLHLLPAEFSRRVNGCSVEQSGLTVKLRTCVRRLRFEPCPGYPQSWLLFIVSLCFTNRIPGRSFSVDDNLHISSVN
jgi:hypothetical protein